MVKIITALSIEPDMLKIVDNLAREDHRGRSDYIRLIIYKFLKEKEKEVQKENDD
jgi:metal-responsive CopG/Arc/MetJ family transcriptional regulator